MFNTDIYSLFQISVSDNLVEDDSNRGFRDIVDYASLSTEIELIRRGSLPLVVLVRHTLVDGGVDLDIHDVTDLVGDQVL
jgi:hypothetical protein